MDDYMMWMQALNSFNNSLANASNVYMTAQTDDDDRAFSERMTRDAWQHNIDVWNMQNEYNLPINQYKRQLEGLRANGLNPNLVYGSSSGVSGQAGSIAPMGFQGYHSTAVPKFGPIDSVDSLLSTRLLQTQIAAQEANVRLINAKADNEAGRLPGTKAKAEEAAYRWNYIKDNISDSYEAGIRAQEATKYWKGVEVEYNAHTAKYKSDIQYYDLCAAEWLNTTKVPGTELTYKQFYEQYKAMIPGAEFAKLKAAVLDIASQMTYRAKQGRLLDLKIEYQGYVNKYAALGRSLGNNWLNTLFSGLMWLWDNNGDVSDWLYKQFPGLYEKDPVERGMAEPDWVNP